MKVSQTFIPNRKNIEKKIKEMLEDCSKRETCIQELEQLKIARTRDEKKVFLESFVKHIPRLIEKVREKMDQTNIDRIYLDDPADYKTRDYGYRTRFEIRSDGHFYFLHYISGNGYKSNLDEDYYKNYGTIYDYIRTYPDKENNYPHWDSGSDPIERPFKQGKEMYEGIKLFLEENKTL